MWDYLGVCVCSIFPFDLMKSTGVTDFAFIRKGFLDVNTIVLIDKVHSYFSRSYFIYMLSLYPRQIQNIRSNTYSV